MPVVVLARATIDLGDATGWTPKVTVIWTFASARPHYLPSACLATRAETREVSTGCAIFRTISTLVLHVNVLIRCALTLGFGSQRETIVDAFNTFSSLIPTVSAHAFGAERTRIVTRVVLPVATRNQLDALKGGRDVEQALRSVNRFVVHGLVQERFWVPEAVALICIGIVDPRLLTFKTIAGSEFAFHAVFHVARCAVVCPVIPLLKLNTFDQVDTGVIGCFQKLMRLLSFCQCEVAGTIGVQTLGVPENKSVLAFEALPIIHSAPGAVLATVETVVLSVVVLPRLADFEPLTFTAH